MTTKTTYSSVVPSLPGTPKSHAERNAQAHTDSIVGAYTLVRAASGPLIDWDIVGPEGRDLLPELSWNDGDGSMALQDAAEQYCYDQPLSITQHGYSERHSGCWNVTSVRILLTCGGPALTLICDDDCTNPKMIFSEAGTAEAYLPLTDIEQEALEWFSSLVAS